MQYFYRVKYRSKDTDLVANRYFDNKEKAESFYNIRGVCSAPKQIPVYKSESIEKYQKKVNSPLED